MICSPTWIALAVVGSLALAQTPSLDEKHKNLKLYGDRFRALKYDEMTPAQKKMIDHLLEGERGGTAGPFNVMLRSPEMGDIAQQLGAHMRYHSSLPRKLNEFAIILTGRYMTSQYEFFAHRPLALQAGLTQQIVDAVTEGRRPAGMQQDEEAIYNFVQELLNRKQVTDATFKTAADRFGEQGVVDAIALTGYYQIVCGMLNVDRYLLPDGAKPPLKPLP
jgi:4-carboxymuconolactone decarboxylase